MNAVLNVSGGHQIPLRELGLRPWSDLVPHGGGAVAIVIAGIVIAVVAATITLERGRSTRTMFAWMITAFVVTCVVASAAVYFMS